MSIRQKVYVALGTLMLAACAAPTAPANCGDVVTLGVGRCAAN